MKGNRLSGKETFIKFDFNWTQFHQQFPAYLSENNTTGP